MNQTAEKFGYPQTLIHEYEHWLVLLRQQQVTLGSLVLVCKDAATRFSDVSQGAFTELHDVIGAIERALGAAYHYDKINYLMLMMVDRDVHYHVIPRYEQPREFQSVEVRDQGWPGPPALAAFVELGADEEQALIASLRAAWR